MNKTRKLTLLTYTRALYSTAKDQKKLYWRLEISASVASLFATIATNWRVTAVLVVIGIILKVSGKAALTEAKGLFRKAERGRRYDFEERCLGWPPPPRDRADMHLESAALKRAELRQDGEDDYFTAKGSANALTFLSHFTESAFWTERLLSGMGKLRWKQFILSAAFSVLVLTTALLFQGGPWAGTLLKLLAVNVSLLLSLDLYGEARSFQRGEKEIGIMLEALTYEGRSRTPDVNEMTRLFIEYNCALAEFPMIPDNFYENNRTRLNVAWDSFRSGIPALCDNTDSH